MILVSDWLIETPNLIGREWNQIENDSKAKKLYKENRLKRLYDPIHRAQKSNVVILHYVITKYILLSISNKN